MPKTFVWAVGTYHLVVPSPPTKLGPGARVLFTGWSDAALGAYLKGVYVSIPPGGTSALTAEYVSFRLILIDTDPKTLKAGWLGPPGEQYYAVGSTPSFTAATAVKLEAQNYRFAGWVKDGILDPSPTLTFPVEKALTLVARYLPVAAVTPVLRGDLNNNGWIELGDSLLALKFAVGARVPTPEQVAVADVAPKHADGTAGDGRLGLNDAIRLLRRTVGLEPDPFP